MKQPLTIHIRPSSELGAGEARTILSLCNRAYREDLARLFATLQAPTHVLGFENGKLVSHALWVTRWFQPGDGPLLRTAYVEFVATEPGKQGRGYATAVMRELGTAIAEYDLGALSPARSGIYSNLGWIFWRGPLFIREKDQVVATPQEKVMVLKLPKSPSLDLDEAMSAEWREGELW